jgi:acylphosphatase
MSSVVRRRVFYSGRVQGVGFRFTAQRAAGEFAVTGWVRNLADGRVELLAEGERPELDAFIARLAEIMADNIDSAEPFDEPATGEFGDFRIAR